MPIFYFDITDRGNPITDHEGRELPDITAARQYALQVLGHFAKHHCDDEPFCDFRITVKDHHKQVRLTLWLEVQEGRPSRTNHTADEATSEA